MKELLPDLDRWQHDGEEIALATLVRVRGTAPRRPGARMGMTRSGKLTASISGGCVENDVFARAVGVLDRGEPVLDTWGISDEMGFEVGLSCGGEIDVVIEPFIPDEAWMAARRAVENQRPVALCLAVSPPSLLARRLSVAADGVRAGSVDPVIDDAIASAASRLLSEEGDARVVAVPWHGKEAGVFIEVFGPPARLFIVGATHTAISLCQMAQVLGFRVTVIDPRGVFATAERFPAAEEVLQTWPAEAFSGIDLDANAYVVSLSHDSKFDIPTLAHALRSTARYVGALGSRGTHERRKARLREEGFTDADLARIRAPIGLDLGGRSPEEIALSILAEIVAIRHGRGGGPLGAGVGR